VLLDRSDAEFKIGETLPPSAQTLLRKLQLLDLIQNRCHIPCYGNQSAWGGSELADTDFIFDPHGSGWHLDRVLFDEQLRQEAKHCGVHVHARMRVLDVSRSDNTWRLKLDDGAKTIIRCKWLLDASGRSRWLARKLDTKVIRYDSLIAFAAVFDTQGTEDVDSRTLVESVPTGWWYTALLPEFRRIAVFFTDAGAPGADRCRDRASFLHLLEETNHVKNRIARNSSVLRGPLARPAESARLEQFAGSNWLALGDAAMSFDPLSSQGILTAMRSAAAAANAIKRNEAGDVNALEEYSSLLRKEYGQYLRERDRYYAMETRWWDQPFWRSRVSPGSENHIPPD
jgi:flavin-dependent dehydrogenase